MLRTVTARLGPRPARRLRHHRQFSTGTRVTRKFDGLEALDQAPRDRLSRRPAAVGLALGSPIDDEPEIDSLLRDLRAVRVYIYDSLERHRSASSGR